MSLITLAGLARDVKGFLAFKRALGRSYQDAERRLESFQRFAQAYAAKAGKRSRRGKRISLAGVIRAWLSRPSARKPVTAGLELGLLRHLCLYRRRHDRNGFVPEQAWAPQTESLFAPHVFSHAEIRQLLNAASRHRGRNIWAGMLHTLLLILYCTGLRGFHGYPHTWDIKTCWERRTTCMSRPSCCGLQAIASRSASTKQGEDDESDHGHSTSAAG
jgi:integrase/recombinase XerD